MHIDLTLSDSDEDEHRPQLQAATRTATAAKDDMPAAAAGQQQDPCVMLLSSDDEQEPHAPGCAPSHGPSPVARTGGAPAVMQRQPTRGSACPWIPAPPAQPAVQAPGSLGAGGSGRQAAGTDSDSDDDLDLGFLRAAGARAGSTGAGHSSGLLAGRTGVGQVGGPAWPAPQSRSAHDAAQGRKRSAPSPDPYASSSQLGYDGTQQEHGGYGAWGSQQDEDAGGTRLDSGRGVKARKGPVDKEAAKAAREEAKALKAVEKLAAKEAKAAERARAAAEKKAAKEGEKAAKKVEKEVTRALSGTGAEKNFIVRMSTKLMESDWCPDLVRALRDGGFEYQVDASLPLGSEYACARFTRRMPRAAAASFFEGDMPLDLAGSATGPAHEQVEVFMPLLLIFLTPAQMCTQLASASMLGPTFNRSTVLDALMDVGMQFPAVRLRTELRDGPHASEFMHNITRQLAQHHKKQQDGYLASFGADKVPARHPALQGEPPSTRTLAHALSHLVTGGDKAVAVAKQYKSAAALLRAYNNPALSTKQLEGLLLGISLGIGQGSNLGAKSAKDVYEYFVSTDPNAPWREDAAAGME